MAKNQRRNLIRGIADDDPGYAMSLLQELGYSEHGIEREFEMKGASAAEKLDKSVAKEIMSMTPEDRNERIALGIMRRFYAIMNIYAVELQEAPEASVEIADKMMSAEKHLVAMFEKLGAIKVQSKKMELSAKAEITRTQRNVLEIAVKELKDHEMIGKPLFDDPVNEMLPAPPSATEEEEEMDAEISGLEEEEDGPQDG